MGTIRTFQTFVKRLSENMPYIDFDQNEDSVRVNHSIDNVEIEFLLNYNVKHFDYVSASHEQPEEYSLKFEATSFEELTVFINGQEVEPNDEQTEAIEEVLSKLIY